MERRDPDQEPYRVSDRRWWARDDEEQSSPEISAQEDRKPSYVESLEEKVRERDAKLRETLEHWSRASAEFEAAKARLERDAARTAERERRSFLRSFLEILDDLDRALEAGRQRDGDPALLEGIELVRQRFLSLLESYGVSRFEAAGEPFDPARHEAVSAMPAATPAEEGAVLEVVKPGYLIGEETLRPAQVVVGRSSP